MYFVLHVRSERPNLSALFESKLSLANGLYIQSWCQNNDTQNINDTDLVWKHSRNEDVHIEAYNVKASFLLKKNVNGELLIYLNDYRMDHLKCIIQIHIYPIKQTFSLLVLAASSHFLFVLFSDSVLMKLLVLLYIVANL